MPMYNPGRNKKIAKFYDRKAKLIVDPKTGEKKQVKNLICKEWVELIPITGRQFLDNRKEENEISYRLRMRYRKEIEMEDIVIFDNKKCYITFMSEMGRYMELVVRWSGE